MKKDQKIYVVTLPNGYFGSTGCTWRSLDPEKITTGLSARGASVTVVPVDKLLSIQLKQDDIVIYTSSAEPNIRAYIRDVMYFVEKKCKIIPRYELLLAHENKGFQQLCRDQYGFGNLKGGYVFDVDNLPNYFPFVYKNVTGAGSSGVSLVRSQADVERIRKRDFRPGMKRRAINLARRLKLTEKEYQIYGYRHKGFNLSVYQQFIPDLSCDYKVLVFFDKIFVLRRRVRKNDFRASGSGMFTFEKPPVELLDFASDIFSRLGSPYASLDIAVKGSEAYLIEYQCMNFGPYTLINSPGHYVKRDGDWSYIEGRSDLEECFSYALTNFIDFK